MLRREILISAGSATAARLLAAAGLSGAAVGCGSQRPGAATNTVGGDTVTTEGSEMEPENELQLAAAGCTASGDACLAHCLRLMGQGDTSLAACAKGVVVMLAICDAIGTLADNQSRHLRALASLCKDVCEDCAEACEPHAGHHAECGECLQACRRMIAVTQRLVEGDSA